MNELSGKIAIVTGGAGGIGAATTRLFVEAGAKVIFTDLAADKGQDLAKEIGNNAFFIRQDVSKAEEWEMVVAETEAMFGPVSILVNNAGMTQPPVAIDKCSEADYRRIIEVNQFSVFFGMRAVVPSMRKAGGGSIVNISSVAGLRGFKGAGGYVASKHAVTGMTKVAALDFGTDNIRVNSVHPGAVDTQMIRPATPEPGNDPIADFCATLPISWPAAPAELGRVILFLASDAASFCTGAAFTADGGWTI